jgi:hypothetical protein
MNYFEKRKINVRPHPCPLPQERENYSLSRTNSCDCIDPTVFREFRSDQLPLPLPRGESQGEGGRF